MKEIEVIIDYNTGQVIFDNKGFQGKECEKINDVLTEAVGGTVEEVSDKPEKEQEVYEQNIQEQSY